MTDASPWIVNVTEETFETAIVEASKQVPVIVDFHAAWCEPCQLLGPTLEKLAQEGAGSWVLAKVDVDSQPGLAQAFGVQSIPVVFALRDGQIVDTFAGNVPEEALREWLARFQPTAEQSALADAIKLAGTDPRQAEEKFQEALELTTDKDPVRIAMARFYLDQHRDGDARGIIEQLEARGFLEPAAVDIKAELDLPAAAAEAGGVAECRAALAAKPDSVEAKLHLAEALAAVKQYGEALELCLELVRSGDAAVKEQGKTTMVNLFHLLGNGAELTQTYRRKLATALY
jgi:putative thioredoxin